MKVNYVHFTTIESTNDWAMENSSSLDPAQLTVIIADEQTAGHGRQGRPWISPAQQNLYMTLCIFPSKTSVNYSLLTFVMALAVAKVLKEYGMNAEIKWPNDLIIGGKKIGGILCESKTAGSSYFIAIGVGLNVNMPKEELERVGRPATSIAVESGQTVSIESIKDSLVSNFITEYNIFMEKGFAPFVEPLRRRMKTDTAIRFHHGNTIINGVLKSFNEDGSITLVAEDGTQKTFVSGEILN